MNELERATRAMEETRWSDAIPDLRTIHDRTPDNVDVAGKLGFALSRDERYGDAISVFERLSAKHPKEAKWPYMVGYQYYQQKEWAQAIDWFARALALWPTYVKVLYRKGYAHTAIGQEPEATKALIECITSWEKMSQDAQELDRSSYGKAQFQLGKLYLKKGLSLKARRHLQVAAQVHSEDHDVRYELGQCYLKNNQLDDALRELQAADHIKPGTDYILDRLAQTYARKGDYSAAERVYQRIPEHRRRPFVLQHLGTMYLEQGQREKALPYLQLAARKQRDNHNIHYAIGQAQEAIGQLQAAHDSYALAVKFRKTKYNLEFKQAQEALERITETLANLPTQKTPDPTKDNEGVIESYNESRGFGFINNKSHERLFFHVSSFAGKQKPARGSRVTFTSESSPKGLRAVHVELAEK